MGQPEPRCLEQRLQTSVVTLSWWIFGIEPATFPSLVQISNPQDKKKNGFLLQVIIFSLLIYYVPVAMKAMNKVASHINEMQKIHEEYGAVFDQLIGEQTTDKKEVRRLLTRLTRFWSFTSHSIHNRFCYLIFCFYGQLGKYANKSDPSAVQHFMADLSMGELLLHATVSWINPPSVLLKGKKDPDLAAFGKSAYSEVPSIQFGSQLCYEQSSGNSFI